MLLLGNQNHSESIVNLAGNLLAGFCSLQNGTTLADGDLSEEVNCLDAVRDAEGVNLQVQERNVLNRLQAILEARIVKREGHHTQFDSKRSSSEVDGQTIFMSVLKTQQEEQSGWYNCINPPALPKSVEPEVANFLHFLVSEGHCEQSKTIY